MSRQLEQKLEDRQAQRVAALVTALEYGIVGALESQGDIFLGFAIRYAETSCLLTIKGIVEGEHSVAFVGSDSMANCILKTAQDARNGRLRWRQDKYWQKPV